jgi:sodium transport system ATP-binding protein
MIEARNLTKTFKDKKRGLITAVADVSFACRPGQIYGLLGANGAGKTTTLRMLATLLQPTGGTATVARHDVAAAAEKVRANVGFLAASTALYGSSTAWAMRRLRRESSDWPTSSACTNSSTAGAKNFPPA